MIRQLDLPPLDNTEFRKALYHGGIFLLPPTPASRRLAASVRELVEGELSAGGDLRTCHERHSDEEFFHGVGRLRKVLYEEAAFLEGMRQAAGEWGFSAEENAFDPLRLRVSKHNGHRIAAAAPIYYPHRDTWYAHPQSLVSWWIALHDTTPEETFHFYPGYFDRPAANDSGDFDYDRWSRDRRSLRVGWQDAEASRRALYPTCTADLSDARALSFACRTGEILVFAGAQLHQTRRNETGRTRFSVDFRTVHLADHAAGLGAPNADNRSTGSALPDYFHP
jgi:hypothetical protein